MYPLGFFVSQGSSLEEATTTFPYPVFFGGHKNFKAVSQNVKRNHQIKKCVSIWSQSCLLSEGTKTKQQQHQYFSILNNTTSYALPQQCQVNLRDLHPIHLIEKVAFLLLAIKIQNRIAVFYDTFYSFSSKENKENGTFTY